jgi:hypothetical protein
MNLDGRADPPWTATDSGRTPAPQGACCSAAPRHQSELRLPARSDRGVAGRRAPRALDQGVGPRPRGVGRAAAPQRTDAAGLRLDMRRAVKPPVASGRHDSRHLSRGARTRDGWRGRSNVDDRRPRIRGKCRCSNQCTVDEDRVVSTYAPELVATSGTLVAPHERLDHPMASTRSSWRQPDGMRGLVGRPAGVLLAELAA